ncbi:hypothetical protein HWV62_30021 [Athelia sp. TMB]|nr:hypothetical protein HWV62_30021 [Athelia sp. TMB]
MNFGTGSLLRSKYCGMPMQLKLDIGWDSLFHILTSNLANNTNCFLLTSVHNLINRWLTIHPSSSSTLPGISNSNQLATFGSLSHSTTLPVGLSTGSNNHSILLRLHTRSHLHTLNSLQSAHLASGKTSLAKGRTGKNLAIVGAQRKKSRLRLEVTLPFKDFWACACARMDLDPDDAELGWKFEGQPRGELCNELSIAEDLDNLFTKAINKEKQKVTREVEVNIHNFKAPALAPTAQKLKELKEHLSCQKHNHRFCYVSPLTSKHVQMGDNDLGLWARKMMLGEATKETPPNCLSFDHCPTKKARTNTKAGRAHIEINNYMPGASNPLTDLRGQRLANTSMSLTPLGPQPVKVAVNSDDDDLVVFPEINQALEELNRVAPKDNWLTYKVRLCQYGVNYVDWGELADETFLE